jgi:nitrogen regulatory protein P-II 1
MKRVEAYIQPFMLSRVLHELREAHVHGLTVSDGRGFGREKDESYPHHASDYGMDFSLARGGLCRRKRRVSLK